MMGKNILNSKIVVGLVISSLFFVACGGSPKWALYESQEGSYKAEYPGVPTQETDEGTGFKLDIVETKDTGFSVGYLEGVTENFDLENSVNGALQGSIGVTPDKIEDTTVDSFPCKSATGEGKAEGSDAEVHVMVCKTDSKVYIVQALGAKGKLKKEDVDRFMKSFQIVNS